ncbi:cyclin-A3-4-like [Corylus avellana]|uniref:cyclin-A3-4-like n=1 Tax=Corylus avellana TaxID=13451 RepID=UPI00286CCFE5|nr:cyclin-A3-4-like [Corylus avellana]
MSAHENPVQDTRSSKRRAPAAHSQQFPTAKKRVVLGDLTNSLNLGSFRDSDLGPNKPKCTLKWKEEEEEEEEDQEPRAAEIAVSSMVQPPNCSYSNSIYKHLRAQEMEVNRRPLPGYMESVQNDVAPYMREILLDWLAEVAEEYKIVPDTLYLTVSYLDRFLSYRAVSRKKIQLLGVSCMLIASKYEEISPPHIEDFCYVTDNTYTMEEVVDMERDVLEFLNFEMGTPTTKTFLRIFTRVAEENGKSLNLQLELLGCYLAELSLLDYRCVSFLPSVLAASAVFLSRFTIDPEMHPWSLALQCYSGYRPSDLKECVLAIHDLQLNRKGSSLHAVREKYRKSKYMCISKLTPPSEIPACYFEAING